MVVLRCTRKLLARIGELVADPPASTTRLGDWHAAPLAIGRRRFVLLIGEHSRLAVLMPGRDVRHLARNFAPALESVLLRLGISPEVVECEVEASRQATIATTNNRSLLGTINDFSNLLRYRLYDEREADLVELSLWLSHTPVRPLGPGWPDELTRQLLGEPQTRRPSPATSG